MSYSKQWHTLVRTSLALSILILLLLPSTLFAKGLGAAQQQSSCQPGGQPVFISEVLSSSLSNSIPNNRLQVVIWYDGDGQQSTLQIEYRINPSTTGWLAIGGGAPGGAIDPFSVQIETREYDLCGYDLTGQVKIDGVVPNGQIDGMAFGLYTRNASGQYNLWQSWSTNYNTTSDYVGMWPVGVGEAYVTSYTPQLNTAPPVDLPYIRQTALMIIASAKYLGNGAYSIKPEQTILGTGQPGTPNCGLAYVTDNLSSNLNNGLANNTLQVAAWYDGNINPANPPRLSIAYIDPTNLAVGWITIGDGSPGGPIDPFGAQIETREYKLGSCQLTGMVKVSGNVPDGTIDGLAFGLYTKNVKGQYKLCQSRATTLNTVSNFVGSWPIGFGDAYFAAHVPQVTDGYARQQGRGTISSAQYAQDGVYKLCDYSGYFPG